MRASTRPSGLHASKAKRTSKTRAGEAANRNGTSDAAASRTEADTVPEKPRPEKPRSARGAKTTTRKTTARKGSARARDKKASRLSEAGSARSGSSRMGSSRSGGDPDRLWAAYKKTGDQKTRNALVECYVHIVRFVAERIFSKLPSSVDLDDLTSAGVFGLFNAIDGYDFDRGTKFETYCATRVRGAILDELRSQDWVPRMIRAKANRIQSTYEELENRLQRDPTREEMAVALEVSVAEYEQMLQESTTATLVSLNKKVDETDGQSGSTQADILEDKRGPSPYDTLQMKDVIRLIHRNLTKQERLIVLLYYYEELTMKEIGAALDLSESRVCQILSKVTQRLKGRFKSIRNELLSG